MAPRGTDQPRFRSFEVLLRGVRSGDADLRQVRRVLLKLTDRLVLELSQLLPLLVDDGLEILEPLRGVLLQAGARVGPLGKMRFELVDDGRVPLGDGGPSAHDLGALLGERGKASLGVRVARRLATQALQLCLQIGGRRFEVGDECAHPRTVRG
jgi:hypothetical protein